MLTLFINITSIVTFIMCDNTSSFLFNRLIRFKMNIKFRSIDNVSFLSRNLNEIITLNLIDILMTKLTRIVRLIDDSTFVTLNLMTKFWQLSIMIVFLSTLNTISFDFKTSLFNKFLFSMIQQCKRDEWNTLFQTNFSFYLIYES